MASVAGPWPRYHADPCSLAPARLSGEIHTILGAPTGEHVAVRDSACPKANGACKRRVLDLN